MNVETQGHLFEMPPARLSKRARRQIENTWRADVDRWAARVLSFDLVLAYADPDNELTAITIDSSGPPIDWRKRIVAKLEEDTALDLSDATNPALVKTAVRIGRLPRSIVETRPPKPEELVTL